MTCGLDGTLHGSFCTCNCEILKYLNVRKQYCWYVPKLKASSGRGHEQDDHNQIEKQGCPVSASVDCIHQHVGVVNCGRFPMSRNEPVEKQRFFRLVEAECHIGVNANTVKYDQRLQNPHIFRQRSTETCVLHIHTLAISNLHNTQRPVSPLRWIR